MSLHVCFMLTTHFPLGNLEVWSFQADGACVTSPSNTPGTESLISISGIDNIEHGLSPVVAGELTVSCVCDSTGRGFWKLVPGFFQTLPHEP